VIHNERIKLLASLLNGIASSAIVAGVVAPIAAAVVFEHPEFRPGAAIFAYSFGPGSAPFYTWAATPSWEGCAMSNFEFFYLVVGPIAMLSIGAVLFFGGRWLIELADRKTHRPAE
jgi:hypothetical protein